VAVRRRVLVSGRVQGVWFRDSCSRQASAAGVTGWVRNTPDGRVEAAFEGEPEAVEQMVAWCRQGPPRAVVTGVEIKEESPEHETRFRTH
jgi:acylphosphatase